MFYFRKATHFSNYTAIKVELKSRILLFCNNPTLIRSHARANIFWVPVLGHLNWPVQDDITPAHVQAAIILAL